MSFRKRSKKITHIRIGNETATKINRLKLDVGRIQQKPITNRELMKRTFNMPEVEENLKLDADVKRRRNLLR